MEQVSYFDPDLVTQLSGLRMRAAYIADGLVAGGYTSKRYGSSIEFADHKQYTPGDESRHIDWKLNARTDRYFVRRFEDESNRHFHFVIDCSGSMKFAGQGSSWSKWDCAATIALALSTVCISSGDAAGWTLLQGNTIQWSAPARVREALGRLEETLLEASPQGQSSMLEGLEATIDRLRRRTCIVILSDLLDDPMDLENALGRLIYQGHQAILLQVLDKEEVQFRRSVGGRFIDLEDGESLLVDPLAIRNQYLKLLDAHQHKLASVVGRLNAHLGRCRMTRVDTSAPLLRQLVFALDQTGEQDD